jgi:hypothetical protein
MATYRLIEIKDKFINEGKPFWKIEKLILGLWWTEYFEEHSEWGATFYERKNADIWYNYHIDKKSRTEIKTIEQTTI